MEEYRASGQINKQSRQGSGGVLAHPAGPRHNLQQGGYMERKITKEELVVMEHRTEVMKRLFKLMDECPTLSQKVVVAKQLRAANNASPAEIMKFAI